MDEVRCPMCGKSNPAELETCQFCQARLKPLRVSSSAEETAILPGEAPTPEKIGDLKAGLPDWLQSVRQPEKAESTANAAKDASLDWLSGLRDESGQEGGIEADQQAWTPDEQFLEPTAEEFDRIRGLTPKAEEPETPEQEQSNIPDWLSKMEQEKPEAGSAVIPDWFAKDQEREATLPAEAAQDAGQSDWLSGEESGLPDWLSQAVIDETPSAPPLTKPGETELPDWLSPDEESDLPSWLSDKSLKATTSGDIPSAEVAGHEEMPAWLAGLEDLSGVEPEASGLPDWMRGQEKPAIQPALESTPPSPSPVPDWMKAFEAEPFTDQLAFPEQPGPVGEVKVPEVKAPEVEEPQPGDLDWLKELGTNFPGMPVQETPAGVVPGKEPEEAFVPDEKFSEGPGESLPDWLSQGLAAEQALEAPAPQEEAPGLTPASLPSWLEAMRPVESVGEPVEMFESAVGEAEGAGPLSGLKGVLPAEPDISYVRKPPVYTIKLQVGEAQQANADLFAQLVKSEGEAPPIPGHPVITSQHVLRMAIAVLLILAILLPLITGAPQLQLPAFTSEIFDANQLIQSLPSGAPVLLAIDYEPGLSGEMDVAVAPVVDHLMINGAFLAIVSTTPTGPIQAERLISNVKLKWNHPYNASENYINLGFIPGGSAGLLSFVESPRQILPYALNGKMAWDSQPLQGVGSLSDFSLVVVATENPDTARSWIEQVQPRLEGVPMVMVISAQAEPIVRPYYIASPKQVQGIVSGLAGGAAYEAAMGRGADGQAYWSSFSIGMLMASFLILVGGVVNAVSGLRARGKEGTGGEG